MSSIKDYAKEISDYADRHNLMDEDAAFFQRLIREALHDERERAAKIEAETEIKVGDRVRVEFWPMKNDLCGDVLYVPSQPGESWIIRSEDRVFYVQHFATLSKRIGE